MTPNIFQSTIRAAQPLAGDLQASIDAIKPLREEISSWYSNLPTSLQWSKSRSMTSPSTALRTPMSVASLHFAYLTSEVLLYRALLRPLGRVDFNNDMAGRENPAHVDDSGAFGRVPSSGVHQSFQYDGNEARASFNAQAEVIIRAAENCAGLVIAFTAELMSFHLTAFWYSCKAVGLRHLLAWLTLRRVQNWVRRDL